MKCFLGVGGNFDHTYLAIQNAFSLLKQVPEIWNLRSSRLYRTLPVATQDFQKDFLNCVLSFQTSLSLTSLWHLITSIEAQLGKKKKPKNASRLIDLDLLFYGSLFFHSEELTIPHPLWHTRLFVVAPLCDLIEKIDLYPNNLKNWNFGCAKTPGLIDRKRPHISNIESFTIDQAREFSRQPKSNSSGCLGIPTSLDLNKLRFFLSQKNQERVEAVSLFLSEETP